MTTVGPEPVCVPDLIEPVIGFRQWRLADDGLLSLTVDELWQRPTLQARCRLGEHPQEPSPTSHCSCGVYAWYEPCPRTASAATTEIVAGAVAMWGAIELHVDRMRAQHCLLAAVALPLSRWGKRDRVRRAVELLGVPAVRHRRPCDLVITRGHRAEPRRIDDAAHPRVRVADRVLHLRRSARVVRRGSGSTVGPIVPDDAAHLRDRPPTGLRPRLRDSDRHHGLIARRVLFTGLIGPNTIVFRERVFADCLARPDVDRQM